MTPRLPTVSAEKILKILRADPPECASATIPLQLGDG